MVMYSPEECSGVVSELNSLRTAPHPCAYSWCKLWFCLLVYAVKIA
jgi:hypothetical protein